MHPCYQSLQAVAQSVSHSPAYLQNLPRLSFTSLLPAYMACEYVCLQIESAREREKGRGRERTGRNEKQMGGWGDTHACWLTHCTIACAVACACVRCAHYKVGANVDLWHVNSDTVEFNVDALEDLLQPNTRLVIVNLPHNPTGSFCSRHAEITRLHFRRTTPTYPPRHRARSLSTHSYTHVRARSACIQWPNHATKAYFVVEILFRNLHMTWGVAIAIQERC